MLRPGLPRFVFICCFLLSGAVGLAYEVIWLRQLDVLFGTTAYATAAVIAAYMAGLGLGARVFGARIDRACRKSSAGWLREPLAVYGTLELMVAVYALLTPLVWLAMDRLHLSAYRLLGPAWAQHAAKFGVAFCGLLPLTLLMGGTLPVAAAYLSRQPDDSGRTVGFLYGANTTGAAIGVFGTGFFLLPQLGVQTTLVTAAGAGLFIGGVCLLLARLGRSESESASKGPEIVSLGERWNLLLALFALSGAGAMIYEVSWTRVLAVVLGSSVYAFSTMLGTFLIGIGIGGWVYGWAAGRSALGLRTLALLQLSASVLVLMGLRRFPDLPYEFVRLYAQSAGNIGRLDRGKIWLCASIMLPTTLVLGAAFVAFVQCYRNRTGIGAQVGNAYLANSAGGIAGSLGAGFVLIPLCGAQSALVIGAMLSALVAIGVWVLQRQHRWIGAALLAAVTLAALALNRPWDQALIVSGTAAQPARAVGLSREQFTAAVHEKVNVFYREGAQMTVSVDRWHDDILLSVNGKVDASSGDAFTQLYLGHLPMLLHGSARDVLVIGLGSGMTAHAVACYPAERIDCAEIEPAVVAAARQFDSLNGRVLDDPRLRLTIADGRNFLRMEQRAYDVIISEPSNPWMAGVANLFTREHYDVAKGRLRPGGLYCQWFHAYSMAPEDLRMIVNTFGRSFAQASLWTPFYPDLLLIGANEPGEYDFKAIERGFRIPQVAEEMRRYGGIRSPAGLLATFLLGDPALRALGAGAEINSDAHPRLEFSAPRYLYRDTVAENLALIRQYRTRIDFPIRNVDPPTERNAVFWTELARGFLARKLVSEAAAALRQASKIDPQGPGLLEVTGILHAGMGKLEEAKSELLAALSKGDVSGEPHFYLGLIFRQQNDLPGAEQQFRSAVKADPRDVNYLRGLADVLLEEGKHAEARTNYEAILTLRERDQHASARLQEIAAHLRQ